MKNKLENPTKYKGNELKYLEKVLNSKQWSGTSGNWNNKLETEFAKVVGTKYAIAMNSGTSTLHSALVACGVKPGDEVLTPALTVFMDTSAILHANAIPVYVDVNKETFNINPLDIEKKITNKTKVIIVVALYGLLPDMDSIMKIAKKHNLVVIEDNAQYFPSNGYVLRGDFASYSFENTKHLSCGEGGMLVTNNKKYAELARKVAGHGFKNLQAEEGRVRLREDVFQNPHYKRHDTLGWNYRLSEFSVAIVLAQLEKAKELVRLRKVSAELFLDVIKDCDYLIPQKVPLGYVNSYYTLGIIYEGEKKIGVSWEDFRKQYIKFGGDGVYGCWSIPYLEPVISERTFDKHNKIIYKGIRYKKGLCPVAEFIQPKIMQFKTNYRSLELADEKAEALRKTIKYFENKKRTKKNV